LLQTNQINYEHELTNFRLHDISLKINEGEIVSLIGPNGSGKSTLLRVISQLLKADSGEVLINNQNIKALKGKELAKTLTMLPQMNNYQLDLTVQELVEFGRHPYSGNKLKLTKEDEEMVDWAIEVTGLEQYRHRLLPSMSGGERQRAWIAMTVAQNPKILLLDEPTTYLDISHQLDVMELVKELNRKYNMTIVMVLHDINQAAQYSDRLIVLKKGQLHYDGLPHCVLCKEMFESIFEIEADISLKDGRPNFVPIRTTKTNRKEETK
jgi:iron complex transport system ATP-binding protein